MVFSYPFLFLFFLLLHFLFTSFITTDPHQILIANTATSVQYYIHGTPRALGYDTCLTTGLSSNGDFHIHTWFDGDLSDSLDNRSRSLQVNDTLVDSHLVGVPGLGTLTVWCLSGGDLQNLGWHSNGTLLDNVTLSSIGNDVRRDLLQLLNLGGGQGDSDLVDLLFLFLNLFLVDWGRHVG